MAVDDLRKRLERLNRGALGGSFKTGSDILENAGHQVPRQTSYDLHTLLSGRVKQIDTATYYAIEPRMGPHSPIAELSRLFVDTLRDVNTVPPESELHPDIQEMLAVGCPNLLFLDLETCGFSGTPVFLIGTMYVRPEGLHVEQLLARTYAEEIGILKRIDQLLQERSYLITFNGKSFDWPFLADRAAVSRVRLSKADGHCDLLHVSRRRYKNILPDCKLQTLERHLCNRNRAGDIAGHDIPAAYHAFVRTDDARELRTILNHNYLDLITMAEVILKLIDP